MNRSSSKPLLQIAAMLVGIILILWVLRLLQIKAGFGVRAHLGQLQGSFSVEGFKEHNTPQSLSRFVGVTGGSGPIRVGVTGGSGPIRVGVTGGTGVNTPKYNENFCKEMMAKWQAVDNFAEKLNAAEATMNSIDEETVAEQQRVEKNVLPQLKKRYVNQIKPMIDKLKKMYEENKVMFEKDSKAVTEIYATLMNQIEGLIEDTSKKLQSLPSYR